MAKPSGATLHPWNVTPAAARDIQQEMRRRVVRRNAAGLKHIKLIAGIDVSVRNNRSRAAVVVLAYDDMSVVDAAVAEQPTPFPYVPGLLSFRECPVVAAAFDELSVRPDVALVDGQGIAHPRRIGLASHVGLMLDLPTVGCAKTRYIGEYHEPHETAGHYTDLVDDGKLSKLPGEVIGGVLRTRDHVKPLFVSIGHKIDLTTSLDLVLNCCRGYRLPEPTRLAHQAAGGADILQRRRRR